MIKNLLTILLISLSTPALAVLAPKSGPEQVPQRKEVPVVKTPVYTPPGHIKIDPPKNWIIDNLSGAAQGVSMVFYPKGGSWADSKAVLYLRTSDRIEGSVQKIIDEDIASYQDINPKVKVSNDANLFTKDNALAVVKKLKDDESGNMELISYIMQDQTISIITLNARNEKEGRKAYPAFKALVNSYQFIDEDKDAFSNEEDEDENDDGEPEKK